MKAELLRPDDERWTTFLEGTTHDVYHLPAYVALCASQEGGEPVAALITDRKGAMLLPLVIRPVRDSRSDATSPYGYPGPLTEGTSDPQFARMAFRHAIELLRQRGVISLFVRTHPLLGPAPDGVDGIVRAGDTVSIDLTQPVEEHWRQTMSGHRSQINRAMKLGRTARFDDDWAHFDTFKRLYRSTMERVAAAPYYFFDDRYFDGIRTALEGRIHLCVVEADGEVAAAALLTETSGIVQYHLSGSDREHAKEGLTKLLLHFVRSWAKERENKVFHLGGGQAANEDDPLLRFKAGFAPRRHRYDTIRLVLDESEYRRLTARRAEEVGGLREGYFPAYRAPSSPG